MGLVCAINLWVFVHTYIAESLLKHWITQLIAWKIKQCDRLSLTFALSCCMYIHIYIMIDYITYIAFALPVQYILMDFSIWHIQSSSMFYKHCQNIYIHHHILAITYVRNKSLFTKKITKGIIISSIILIWDVTPPRLSC